MTGLPEKQASQPAIFRLSWLVKEPQKTKI